jgi:uncharacterized SAM-binding protein YcdF (DUF218 family)
MKGHNLRPGQPFAMIQLFYWHLLTVIIVSLAACGSSEKAFDKARDRMPFDAVIVPGVPFDTAWSSAMKARVLWSHHLYVNGITKNIIYSGSAVYSPFVESRIMALYAQQLGIPKENIFTEEKAEHSTENLFYSYYLAKDLGFNRIALATDPFQNSMLRSFAKAKQLDVAFVPAIFDTIRVNYADVDVRIDPDWAHVGLDFVPLPERESFFKRFRGTMGKNLKYTPEEINERALRYETPLLTDVD